MAVVPFVVLISNAVLFVPLVASPITPPRVSPPAPLFVIESVKVLPDPAAALIAPIVSNPAALFDHV